jgi:hypothetical protein
LASGSCDRSVHLWNMSVHGIWTQNSHGAMKIVIREVKAKPS